MSQPGVQQIAVADGWPTIAVHGTSLHSGSTVHYSTKTRTCNVREMHAQFCAALYARAALLLVSFGIHLVADGELRAALAICLMCALGKEQALYPASLAWDNTASW